MKRVRQLDSDVISSALIDEEESSDNVIGDFSKPCCLPTVPGKHRDLHIITPKTVIVRNDDMQVAVFAGNGRKTTRPAYHHS